MNAIHSSSGDHARSGDILRTGSRSRAELAVIEYSAKFVISSKTSFRLAHDRPGVLLELERGSLRAIFGKLPEGGWGFAHDAAEAKAMGFSAIHVDTMFWSIGLAVLFSYLFAKAAKKATAGVPSGLLNFVEWIVEFVDGSVKGAFNGRNAMVAPMAYG